MSRLLFQAYLFANVGDSLCAYVVFHWTPPEGLGPSAAGNWITRTCCRPVHLGLRVFTLLWRRVFFPQAGIEVGRGRLRSPPHTCRVQSAGRQHSVALWWPKNTHTHSGGGKENKMETSQASITSCYQVSSFVCAPKSSGCARNNVSYTFRSPTTKQTRFPLENLMKYC